MSATRAPAIARRLPAVGGGWLRRLVVARDIPVGAAVWTLTGMIGLSIFVRGVAARGIRSPWIVPDELIYSSLARSFAATAHFAIRGIATTDYSIGYPILLSGAFVHRDPVAAYAAAKWLNAAFMSVAAVPVFLLARRLVSNWLSLVVAGLSLLIPAAVYSGVLMSENAAYPLFLFAVLGIVRALERPTAARQLVVLVAIAATFLVRAECLVLAAVYVVAVALVALTCVRGSERFWRSAWRQLRPFGATVVFVGLGVAAVIAGEAVRGHSAAGILGAKAGALQFNFPFAKAPIWFVYHLVDLELYVGVLPFVPAAFVAFALLRDAAADRARRALAATAVAAVVCVLGLAAVVSARPEDFWWRPQLATAVHDRYTFYVVPLYLILFGYWLARRTDFSNRLLIPLLAGASALPLVLPYATVHQNADFDALALVPWHNALISDRNVPAAMAVTVAVLSLLVLVRRRSLLQLQVGVVALGLFVTGLAAQSSMRKSSVEVPTSHAASPSWVDKAIPAGAAVAVVWHRDAAWSAKTAFHRELALWRAEFFNADVKHFFYLGSRMDYLLPDTEAQVRDGNVVLPGQTRYRFVLAAAPLAVDGAVVARDRKAHLLLYRLRTP